MEAPPAGEALTSQRERPLHILALSARRAADLEQLVLRYRQLIEQTEAPTADICYTANAGRTHFAYRFCAIGRNNADLAFQLSQFRGAIPSFAAPQPSAAFLFPGEGSGFRSMGRELYETSPAFRRAFDSCAAVASSETGWNLLTALYDPGNALGPHSKPCVPCLFAVEYALTQLWRSWGIEPAYVAGEGAGQYAAACVAGMISRADGFRLADAFQTLMDSLPAGTRGASPLVRPLLDAFDHATLKIATVPPQIAFASSVSGQIMGPDPVELHYWRRQVRASFRFSEAIPTLRAQGARVFLVAGPRTAEAATISTGAPEATLVLDSLQAGESDWSAMLKSLKTLYLGGVPVDWVGFDRDYARSRIEAPTYPFQRRDYQPAGLAAP